jgi:N-acetylmuramoyl-L-alanine amidase
VTSELLSGSARLTIDIAPAATSAVTQQGPRLLVRLDADALDLAIPALQPNAFVQALRTVDQSTLAVELGPRFASYRSATQPIDSGSRLVIDVVGAVTEAAPTPAPAPAPPPAADALPRDIPIGPGPVRTVAIDAGHGGADAGARGIAGTMEKDVALAVARRLRAGIEGRLGLRVVMTRDDDRDVPLSERTAIANNNKADLFISLHANASFRRGVSGATVYTAAFAEADIAQEGIASERLPVFGGGQRVLEIVPWSLAQIPHRERSEQLATIVADTLASRVPVAARPIEHAPLRVLESANMPAVLVEIGYLTNEGQEKAIAASELQAAIAQALLDAIVRFRDRVVPEGGVR